MKTKNDLQVPKTGSRFVIVILPNLLFFIDLFLAIILIHLFGLPWLFFPGDDISHPLRFILLIIGYILTILGTILLTWGTLTIGVSRAEGNEISSSDKSHLITEGPYAYIRHPITLGFIFAIPGIAFTFDSVALLIMALLYIPKMILLLLYEEKELMRRFGEIYKKYKDSVPFLIPRKRKP